MSTRRIPATFDLRRVGGAYYDAPAPFGNRLLTLGLAGAVILVELVLAVAVVRPGAGPLLAPLAGAVGLALAFAFPFLTMCVFLALLASVLFSGYFSLHLGVTATSPQLVLFALLVVAALRPRRRTWGGVPGAAIAIFLVLILTASVLAVSSGRVDSRLSRDFTLPFAYFLFYFVLVRLVPEPARMKRLLAVAVGLAGVTGFVALLVAAAGNTNIFLQDASQSQISQQGAAGLLRVRLPGVALAYGLFWYAVVELGRSRRHRVLWAAAFAGMIVSIVVSLNRNMWIGLIFGLALLLVVGGRATRRKLVTSLAATAAAIFLLVIVGPGAVGPNSAVEPLVQRGQTLLSPNNELQDQSLRDRGAETTAAWKALQGHFVLGLGVGAPFGVTFRDSLGGGRYSVGDQTFLHNQYLYLIVAGGVGALAAFLVFLGATLVTAWQGRARDPTLPALLVGLAMIMLSAFVMIAFVDYAFMALLALLAAAVRILAGREPAPA